MGAREQPFTSGQVVASKPITCPFTVVITLHSVKWDTVWERLRIPDLLLLLLSVSPNFWRRRRGCTHPVFFLLPFPKLLTLEHLQHVGKKGSRHCSSGHQRSGISCIQASILLRVESGTRRQHRR